MNLKIEYNSGRSDLLQSILDRNIRIQERLTDGKRNRSENIQDVEMVLPFEILLDILKYLSPKDIGKAALISKAFWLVSWDNSLWLPYLESGLGLIPASVKTLKDRMDTSDVPYRSMLIMQ